eukprot:5986729-Prymnesium_polylepis.1
MSRNTLLDSSHRVLSIGAKSFFFARRFRRSGHVRAQLSVAASTQSDGESGVENGTRNTDSFGSCRGGTRNTA